MLQDPHGFVLSPSKWNEQYGVYEQQIAFPGFPTHSGCHNVSPDTTECIWFFFFSVTCTEKTNVLMNGNVTWNCTDGLIHIYMTCLKSVTESAEATSRICCEFHVQTPSYRSTKRPGNASLNLLIWFIGFTLVFNNTIIRSYNMLPRGMNSMPKFWKAAKNYNTIHCLVRPFSLKEYFCHHTAAFKTSS